MKKQSAPLTCKTSFLCLCLLISKILTAQLGDIGTCNIANQLCAIDLSNPITGLTIGIKNGSNAIVYGNSSPTGFKDVIYGLDLGTCIDAPPNPVDDCITNTYGLKYNVYYPSNYTHYNTCPLYPVIMVHGGSFSECSNFDNAGVVKICSEIAKRGFVVFSVEYRRGVLVSRTEVVDNPLGLDGIEFLSVQQMLAIYRGIQDVRGAMRSIILRERIQPTLPLIEKEPYRIDTTKLFMGGISAGSIISLHTAYYQSQAQLDAVFPGVKNVLGRANQNTWYFADSTVDIFTNLKGVLNMWGAMTFPLNKYSNPGSFFNTNISKPGIISFHGEQDDVVFPITVPVYFAEDVIVLPFNENLGRESRCLTNGGIFTFPTNTLEDIDMLSMGSKSIYTMLRGLNISTELYTDCQMGHGLDCMPGTSGCLETIFDSEFGTHYTNDDDVNEYIAGRAANFFVINAKGVGNKLLKSKFVECKNNRYSCTLNVDNKLPDANECSAYTVEEQDGYSCENILNP